MGVVTYLLRRRRMRSGVLASDWMRFGTWALTSAATDFSEAEGMLVAPPEGAPGSADGSDMIDMSVV